MRAFVQCFTVQNFAFVSILICSGYTGQMGSSLTHYFVENMPDIVHLAEFFVASGSVSGAMPALQRLSIAFRCAWTVIFGIICYYVVCAPYSVCRDGCAIVLWIGAWYTGFPGIYL